MFLKIVSAEKIFGRCWLNSGCQIWRIVTRFILIFFTYIYEYTPCLSLPTQEGNDWVKLDMCHTAYGTSFPRLTHSDPNPRDMTHGMVVHRDPAGNEWIVCLLFMFILYSQCTCRYNILPVLNDNAVTVTVCVCVYT